jgi:putative phosphoesterase
MKIAIISDTHDNIPTMEQAFKWMKENKIEQLIHCGDLCASSMLAKVIVPNFSGKIHMVFGNVEDRERLMELVKQYPNVTHYGDIGETEIDGKKIAFVHYPEKAKELAQAGSPLDFARGEAGSPRFAGEAGNYDLVFYGHNHRPWEEKIGQTRLINPGTLSGMFAKATFAVYNTENDELELKILEML